MTATTNGQRQLVLAGKFYCGNDVPGIGTASNQARLPVNHGVVDLSHRIVARVVRLDELSAKFGFESSNCRFVQHEVLQTTSRRGCGFAAHFSPGEDPR